MADFTPKLYADILQNEIDWVVSQTNKITDFNDGSINKAMLAGVALVVEELYFEIMLSWVSAMRFALQNSLSFIKIAGVKATGNVIFSRTGAAGQTYPIPTGTIVATADGVRFLTTIDAEISIGNTDSASVSIEAEDIGTTGTVNANTINTLVSQPTGVETVDNSAATTGGVDEEADDTYNTRFKLFLQGLTKTTPQGITAGAQEVAGVAEAKLVESAVLGVLTLYINDGSGTAGASLITDVQTKIEGEDTAENPGYRPAGIQITYASSVKIVFGPSVTVYYADGEDPVTLEPLVEAAISGYINALKIGEDVIIKKAEEAMLGVNGVKDINVTLPSSNVTIDVDNGEVAKYGIGIFSMTPYVDLP